MGLAVIVFCVVILHSKGGRDGKSRPFRVSELLLLLLLLMLVLSMILLLLLLFQIILLSVVVVL
jgi:hypothetical protein